MRFYREKIHGTITLDKPVAPTLMEELTELVMREYRIRTGGAE